MEIQEKKNNSKDPEEISESSKDEFRETGMGLEKSTRLSTLDLIYSAILGVMGGFISSLIPFSLLIKVWYPLIGGTQLVSGHHVLWASIIYGLTRKKQNIIVTMSIKGLLEFLLGDPWGLLIIFVNLMEGICLVLGFFLMEKIGEGETKLGWGLAGGFGNFFQAPFFWILNQRFHIHWTLWLLAFIFAFVSGILITGILGKIIKEYLIKAGVPTAF